MVDAYDFARQQPAPASLDTQNPYGYLATITSQVEQNIIYKDIASECGWLGGTRALVAGTNQPIMGGKDNIPLPKTAITDYNITTSVANKWYWANGPEAGETFYKEATYKSTYNPILSAADSPGGKNLTTALGTTLYGNTAQADAVDYAYNYFTNAHNNGAIDPKTNSPINLPSSEPNDYTGKGEAFLQFAFWPTPTL